MELLLEAGADPSLHNGFDQTARDVALGEGNLGCAKSILQFTSGNRVASVQLQATDQLEAILRKNSAAAEDELQQAATDRLTRWQCRHRWSRCIEWN